MLLWVIIKTTDNGAKCLLTGLAIILRNQDRWEHQKLQINLFNNEGPRWALGRVYCRTKQRHTDSLYRLLPRFSPTDSKISHEKKEKKTTTTK